MSDRFEIGNFGNFHLDHAHSRVSPQHNSFQYDVDFSQFGAGLLLWIPGNSSYVFLCYVCSGLGVFYFILAVKFLQFVL